jgi:hypothetical protein
MVVDLDRNSTFTGVSVHIQEEVLGLNRLNCPSQFKLLMGSPELLNRFFRSLLETAASWAAAANRENRISLVDCSVFIGENTQSAG